MSQERPVAVITGGASGIGAGIADAFRQSGYTVAILDIDAGSAEEEEQTLRIRSSVADEDAVDDAFKRIDERLGRVDALVNCAGIDVRSSLLDTDLDSWERVLTVNATGTFLCTRAATRVMKRARRGSIVSISSVNAHLGWRNCTAYSASKGAIEAFTRAAAAELGEFGVRVNAVAPGAIETPIWGDTLTPDVRSMMSARTALGFVGTPSDVASAVVFLSSDAARFITGVVLPVCGGRTTIDFLPAAL